MLELFTKSKIRKRIILLFIYNQNTEFYLSEIARMVNTSAGTAQRELNRLLNIDFIIFRKRANLNIYMLNKKYSLIEEVKAIVRKTFGVEVELRKELSKIINITSAFLFGSYVKGEFKSESDLDLFVIGEMDEDQVFKAVQKVENLIGKEINYHIADKSEFSKKCKNSFFHKEIIQNYILLIGSEDEFRRLVEF